MNPEKITAKLRGNLDEVKRGVYEEDTDALIVVSGREGSGKSSIAFQIASYLDEGFNLSRVAFTPEQFEQAVVGAEPTQAVVWDEAGSGASSFDSMKAEQKSLVKKMQVIREKRLFVIINIPYFFQLNKYFAISRSLFLINCVMKGFKRGKFNYYGYNTKRLLYFKGKKKYWQYCVAPDFSGRFSKGYGLVDEEKYRVKKREVSNERGLEAEMEGRDYYIYVVYEGLKEQGVTLGDVGEVFDLTSQRVGQIVRDYREKYGDLA